MSPLDYSAWLAREHGYVQSPENIWHRCTYKFVSNEFTDVKTLCGAYAGNPPRSHPGGKTCKKCREASHVAL